MFWSLLAASIIILVAIAPVEHKNKTLELLEKKVYRRRMLRNLVIATVAAIGLQMFALDSYAIALLCGILLVTITATLGKIMFAL